MNHSEISPDDLLNILLGVINGKGADPTTVMTQMGKMAVGYGVNENEKPEDNGRSTLDLMVQHCEAAVERRDGNDQVKLTLQNWFLQKDAEANATWNDPGEPSTTRRRSRILEELGVDDNLAARINSLFPVYIISNIVIADDHDLWLTPARKDQDGFFGPSVIKALEQRGYKPEGIASIEQATDKILDYLADPRAPEIHAARGLVVGYVQSGKTTNINVLIAKAIDSGYRLIVVLAGMTDVLRTQTQRRIDKEVIGKSLVEKDVEESQAQGYVHDDDWHEFIEHEARPGRSGGVSIERLTTRRFDFSSVKGGTRFTDDWALEGTSARVVVIKKNSSRLDMLRQDIETMNSDVRRSIPTLIIDDESDQASVNTKKPIAGLEQERTAINKRIVRLLAALPRAQYVGYTATPFANVLVNPDEPEGLFPGDFVVSLDPPAGYMGVRDFHDLDEEFLPIHGLSGIDSNKERHVRDIDSSSKKKISESLAKSIDTFVLTGALKLYREETLGIRFKHHTYFHSDSVRVADQATAAKRITEIWENSGYNTKEGINRLREFYDADIRALSPLCDDPAYFPSGFEDLIPHIVETVTRVNRPFGGHAPVLIVNGVPGSVAPDFERDHIWKFVVGGAKLSRGYTIEGLTVTYFRRKANNQSTLLQMGRWFGYRNGYQDLVRLFISRAEGNGLNRVDVYDLFESICRDEEAFRRELVRYSRRKPDGSRFKPRDIPPLVQNSHPRMMPVARNMMWNARLTARNFGLRLKSFESSAISSRNIVANESAFSELILSATVVPLTLDAKNNVAAYSLVVSHSAMVDVLLRHKKDVERSREEEMFLEFLQDDRCDIDDWAVVLPQNSGRKGHEPWKVGPHTFLTVGRSWNSDECSFGPVGESRHREIGYCIAGINGKFEIDDLSAAALSLRQPRRALLLLYPIRPLQSLQAQTGSPAIGFEYFIPKNNLPEARYEPIRSDRPNDLVVPI